MDKRTVNKVLGALASRGGKASAKRLTAEQRKARARKAAQARWSKKGGSR